MCLEHIKAFLFCTFFLCFFPYFLNAQPAPVKKAEKLSIILDSPANHGMFSCFTMTLGLLDQFEKGEYAGIRIDFGPQGVHHDPEKGPNWWEYYFEPLELGTQGIKKTQLKINGTHKLARIGRDLLGRNNAYRLIQKYIRVKADIQNEVDQFVQTHFTDKQVIGIHYRGTDKITSGEARYVNYENVIEEIRTSIEENDLNNYLLFVATDEEGFLEYLLDRFPNKVVFQNAHRSVDACPVHLFAAEPYLVGREALIDTLLLSRTHFLIRTASNLSLCSTFFNPHLPVKVL